MLWIVYKRGFGSSSIWLDCFWPVFYKRRDPCHFRRRQTADMTGYIQVTVITGMAPCLYLLPSLPLPNIALGSAFRTSLVRIICQHNWDLLSNFLMHKGFQMYDFIEVKEFRAFSIHKFKQSSSSTTKDAMTQNKFLKFQSDRNSIPTTAEVSVWTQTHCLNLWSVSIFFLTSPSLTVFCLMNTLIGLEFLNQHCLT